MATLITVRSAICFDTGERLETTRRKGVVFLNDEMTAPHERALNDDGDDGEVFLGLAPAVGNAGSVGFFTGEPDAHSLASIPNNPAAEFSKNTFMTRGPRLRDEDVDYVAKRRHSLLHHRKRRRRVPDDADDDDDDEENEEDEWLEAAMDRMRRECAAVSPFPPQSPQSPKGARDAWVRDELARIRALVSKRRESHIEFMRSLRTSAPPSRSPPARPNPPPTRE